MGETMRRYCLIATCLLCALLAGCASAPQPPQAKTFPTREPGVYLSASHYPVYLAALQIAGSVEGVHVNTFVQPQGGYLEDFRLSELDWERAQRADILLLMGGGLEDFLPALAAEDGKPLLVAGEHVSRLPGRVLDPDESAEPAENPYTWLSPKRWGQIVDGVAAGLAQLDPLHQAEYVAANNAAQPRIEGVAARLREVMQPYLGRQVIVMHPALAYLAEDAGLQVALTLERDPAAQVASDSLQEIEGLLAAYPDAVLLLEEDAPLALQGLGGRRTALCKVLCQGVLDGDASAWERAMEHNIAALAEALH